MAAPSGSSVSNRWSCRGGLGAGGLSTACQSVVDQATHLKTVQECRSAQNRLISAAMSLAARQLILYVIEALTLHSHDALYRALVSIGLADVSKLVHDAGPNNTARPPTSSTYNWREGIVTVRGKRPTAAVLR